MWRCPICETNNEDEAQFCEICGNGKTNTNETRTLLKKPSQTADSAPLKKRNMLRTLIIVIIVLTGFAAGLLATKHFMDANDVQLNTYITIAGAYERDGVWYVNEEAAAVSWESGADDSTYTVELIAPDGKLIRQYVNTDMTGMELMQSDISAGQEYVLRVTANRGSASSSAEVIVAVEHVVVFTDSVLERHICAALKLESPLTTTDLLALEALHIANAEITDLSDIEYCINLHTLTLYNCGITDDDLTHLVPLTKLTKLDVRGNGLLDTSALDGNENLVINMDTNESNLENLFR